jgi:soluble lytic murein transglycosylase-like protein
MALSPEVNPVASYQAANHKTVAALSLAALAAAVFALGSGQALAPDRELACLPDVENFSIDQAAERDAQPLDPAQRALVDHLSRRFMIAAEAAAVMVAAAHRAARRVGLDPLLVLAVISVESRFNPVAESVMGAKGLMQIIPKFHRDKLQEHGGLEALLDPESNIEIGSTILQEYVYRTGTLVAGLQYYNGASWDESAQYAQKVMAERGRLEQVVRAAAGHRQRAALLDSQGG